MMRKAQLKNPAALKRLVSITSVVLVTITITGFLISLLARRDPKVAEQVGLSHVVDGAQVGVSMDGVNVKWNQFSHSVGSTVSSLGQSLGMGTTVGTTTGYVGSGSESGNGHGVTVADHSTDSSSLSAGVDLNVVDGTRNQETRDDSASASASEERGDHQEQEQRQVASESGSSSGSDCTAVCPPASEGDFSCDCDWYAFVRSSPTTVAGFMDIRSKVRKQPVEHARDIDPWIPVACEHEKYKDKVECHYIPRNSQLFSKLLETQGYTGFSATVGVSSGITVRHWLSAWKSGDTHFCVDPYVEFKEGSGNTPATQEEQDKAFLKTKSMLEAQFGKRIKMIRYPPVEGSGKFKDEKFDFVFLDYDHKYGDVVQELFAWFPKLMRRSILGIHDFNYRPTGFAFLDFVVELNKDGDKPLPIYITQDTGPASAFFLTDDLPLTVSSQSVKRISKQVKDWKYSPVPKD